MVCVLAKEPAGMANMFQFQFAMHLYSTCLHRVGSIRLGKYTGMADDEVVGYVFWLRETGDEGVLPAVSFLAS